MTTERPNYPVQLASIEKNRWRLQEEVDMSLSTQQLEQREEKLWEQINRIVCSAPKPPNTCDLFPDSQLIGSGWEWAVYKLPDEERVVKVPAGVFPEVNSSEYLDNTKHAYEICRQSLGQVILESQFKRDQATNMVFQRLVEDSQLRKVIPKELDPSIRNQVISLGENLLKMLNKYEWIPDLNLHQKELNGEEIWHVWNLYLDRGHLVIFDFTYYYDVFRMYPARTTQEVQDKGSAWSKLLSELKTS